MEQYNAVAFWLPGISSGCITQNTYNILFIRAVQVFKGNIKHSGIVKLLVIIAGGIQWAGTTAPAQPAPSAQENINSLLPCSLLVGNHWWQSSSTSDLQPASASQPPSHPQEPAHFQGITLFPLTATGIRSFLYSSGRYRSISTCSGILSVTSPCLCLGRGEQRRNRAVSEKSFQKTF